MFILIFKREKLY